LDISNCDGTDEDAHAISAILCVAFPPRALTWAYRGRFWRRPDIGGTATTGAARNSYLSNHLTMSIK
jgi:hypothetical protein